MPYISEYECFSQMKVEFEKWRAIHANVGARGACLRG